jgi:site-specific recombinase XerD
VHIYTPQEIAALLARARELPPPRSLRPLTFSTLLGLLACTGLRISEALQLDLADWESTEAVLTIRQAKFGQSRYAPLAPSAAIALKTYLQARAKAFPKTNSCALFLNRQGQRLTYREAGGTFVALREQLNWQHQRPRPRLHDLRHTTAMRLLQADVDIMVIALLLGHESPTTTHHYIKLDLQMKERCLRKLQSPQNKAKRFKPADALLAFLEQL